MRIALDLTSLLPPVAGTGNYAWSLLRELLALDPINQYALLLHAPPGRLPDNMEEIRNALEQAGQSTLRRTRWRLPWLHAAWRRWRWPSLEKLAGGAVDIYHAPAPAPTPPAAPEVRFVTTLPDLDLLREDAPDAEARRVRLEAQLKQYDAVFCHSYFTRAQALEKMGLDGARLHVATPGVDTVRFHPLGDAEAHGKARGFQAILPQHFFLAVGGIGKKESLDTLFSAYNLLKKKSSDPPKIVFAGNAPSAALHRVQKEAAAAKLRDDVFFTGHVPTGTLIALYNLAAAFVATDASAGHGMALLEAMACGAPAIAAGTDTFREAGGAAPYYFPPADSAALAEALSRVALEPARQVELRKKGLDRARECSWRETARKTLAVYEALGKP